MKTSEFIEKLDEHRDEINRIDTVYSCDEEFEVTIKTDKFSITYRNDEEPNGILDIIAEYLNTPVEEREEEKKYYLKHIGLNQGDNTLNINSATRIYFISDEQELNVYKTQFTQSEIDEMPECYTHPAVWEQMPVDEND